MGADLTAYFNSIRGMGNGDSHSGLKIFGSTGVLELTTGYPPAAHYLPDPLWSPGRSGVRWQRISSAGLNQPEPIKDPGLHAGNVAAVEDLLTSIETDRLPQCNMYEGRMTVEPNDGRNDLRRLRQPRRRQTGDLPG